MSKCHKLYPNCLWTVTHCWLNLALGTVLSTKAYWSFSTHIARVGFTPRLKPTLKRDLKRKRNVQINFNSHAMASLFEHWCYYSLELSDPIMDEFLTFIHSTLSSPSSSPANSTVLPEATDGTMYSSHKF